MQNLNAFGYYYMSDPTTFYSGTVTGNNSDYFDSLGMIVTGNVIVDSNTGYLGEFKAGDTIGLWLKVDGTIFTTTETSVPATSGGGMVLRENSVLAAGGLMFCFQLSETTAPICEPLPGVIAALAIGGTAFLGRKFRKSIKK